MKISTRGRYGLRAMVDLAIQNDKQGEKCISLKSIAKRQHISEHYLEQLIASLKKAGLVRSIRGAGGGYNLNCNPKEVSVLYILTILEGSLYPVECVSKNESDVCGGGGCHNCVTKPIWEKLYEGLNNILDGITLYDLVNDYKQLEYFET